MPPADRLAGFLVRPEQTIRDTIAAIDRNGTGLALVVDEECRLLGTVTDGDVRRAILGDLGLDLAVGELVRGKGEVLRSSHAKPVVALEGTSAAELLRLMSDADVRHVPLVDADRRVRDVVLLGDLVRQVEEPLQAVIMAGGMGTRLHPLTADLPKPMLPVGGRPLLERIVEQLRAAGVASVSLTTHYRADQIVEHFGDGAGFGVEISYVTEEEPLGTAGSLSRVTASGPVVVMNGDILTQIDFRALARFHEEHRADMTVCVRAHETPFPFGVVETDGVEIRGVVEKPRLRHLVNAGIYMLGPGGFAGLSGGSQSMVELIEALVALGRRVIAFPIHEEWIDIGEPEAYAAAQARADLRD